MLNEEFCEFLEYELTRALKLSDDKELRQLWCDGILLPDLENEYSIEYINANRKVVMCAFIGKDGQDIYELTLNLGNKSLSRFVRGLGIIECIPYNTRNDWFELDIEHRKIEIMLE
jgi:hypothetical protein